MAHPTQLPSIETDVERPKLNPNASEIRILTLRHGHDDDPITCDLQVAQLDSSIKPTYDALSYVWGDPTIRSPVILDGRLHQVTVNLAAALRRLRFPAQDRRLWVDALCIDQKNDAEKSHQVNLMSRIYSNAQKGLVWLGDYTEDSSECSEQQDSRLGQPGVVIKQEEAFHAFECIQILANARRPDIHRPVVEENNTGDPGGIQQVTTKHVMGVAALMRLSWWERIWTVQEVILPRRVTVICGAMQLDWKSVERALFNMHDYRDDDRFFGPDTFDFVTTFLTQVFAISSTRIFHDDNRVSILEVLAGFRPRVASDNRDKIYALLGLGYIEEFRLIADYSLDWREVYQRATETLLKVPAIGLKCLIRQHEFDHDPDLPSWVPDWRAQTESTQFDETLLLDKYHMFKAAARTRLTVGPSPDGELRLMGTSLDEIVLFLAAEGTDPRASAQAIERSWLDKLRESVDLADTYPHPQGGGYNYTEACFRTARSDLVIVPFGSGYQRLHIWASLGGITRSPRPHLLGTDFRKPFLTKSGLLGMGPRDAQPGDRVYILHGGNIPFVLRRAPQNTASNCFTYVGHAYVDGVMDGEAMDGSRNSEWVNLV